MSFFGNLSNLFANQKTSAKKQPLITQPTAKPDKQDESKAKKAFVHQPKPKAPQIDKNLLASMQREAQSQADALVREATSKAREIIIEAKDEALAIRSESEKKARDLEQQLLKQQAILESKLDRLDNRFSQMDEKEQQLNTKRAELETNRADLEKQREKILKKLEEVSSMTKDEAKEVLYEGLEKKLRKEMAQLIRQRQEEARSEADLKSKEILIDAMRHGATDYVAEYTVSTVEIPSEEIKGKIIGKSGRNIHTFEVKTGVDVDLDSSNTEVKISCFDPVRREIAKISLERLIKDGRIQPARIEEVVDKVKSEIDKAIFEAGRYLCHEVGVYNIPHGLMKILGRFKYRFSYGQNMIAHTLEETKIGIKLAHELGIDVNVVKLGCLLHDVGKVSEETEGSHVELGVKIAKKYGMPQEVIDCIAQHHEDAPFTGMEQMAVYIADAISGARPGARYENFDEYVKRLETLEAIATNYSEVKEAYAIQAGRELRVILSPEQSKEDDVTVLAEKIKDEVQEKVTFPGTVKVTVIREIRGQAEAK